MKRLPPGRRERLNRDRRPICIAALLVATLLPPQLAAPSFQQRPGFDATVAQVRVDVIVTDAAGRFVDDLRPEDFTLFEDGEVQRILNVQLVDLVAGTVANPATNPSAAAAAVSSPTAREEWEGAPNPASDLGAMVFLIDLPGMDWRNKRRFTGAWEQLLADTDSLGIPRAAYLINQVGRLRELTPLTLDVDRLRQAAATASETPIVRQAIHEQLLGGQSTDLLRATDAEERARTRGTLELLTEFCNALAARGGRTALVWITSELQITEAGPRGALAAARLERSQIASNFTADPSRRTGSDQWGFLTLDPQIGRLEEALHQAANSANVSIYTLDPTPVQELRSIGFDVAVRSSARSELLSSPLVQSSLDGLRDGLRNAALATGGKALIHWSDLEEALRDIERDASRFYLLTYATPEPLGDGQYHEIRVEVSGRPGLTVRERRGYVDLPPDERRDRTLTGALGLPGTLGGVPLSARALRRWSPEGNPIVQVAISVGSPTGTAVETQPSASAAYEFHGLAVNDEGDVASEVHEEIRPRIQGAETYTYVHEWPLDSGEYGLHLVVEDMRSGQLRAARLELEVPEASTDWETSDLMLVTGDGNQGVVPLIGDEIQFGSNLAAYVEVFGGQQPILTGDLFDASGTSRVTQLPPLPLDRSSDGIHRGALRMQGLAPGEYTLQVLVTDPPAKRQRAFRASLQVVAPPRE